MDLRNYLPSPQEIDQEIRRVRLLADVDDWFAETPLSDNTIDRYRRALTWILEDRGSLEEVTAPELKSWLDEYGWSASTQWIALNAIKGYVRWKYGDDHPALALKIKRAVSPPQRTLNFAEVRTLLESFDLESVKGRRDLAMASLFIDTGLRVAEVCRLEIGHLDLVAKHFAVIVKGGEWEDGIFSEYTAKQLAIWIEDRREIAGGGVNTVFVSVGGQTPGQTMTRHGLQSVVMEWGESAGIGHISPHCFRRTFATLATKNGAPQRVAMAAGRWRDERIFRRYTQAIGPEDFKKYSPVMAVLDLEAVRDGN